MTNKIMLAILAFFLSTSLVVAATPTPSITDTPVATDSDTIKKELQEKIKNVVDEKLKENPQIVQNTLSTPPTIDTNRWYGFVGSVTAINQASLDLKTNRFGPLQVITASDSAIIKDGKAIKLEQISINDQLIAIGRLNSQGILKAKRLVTIKSTPSGTKQTLIATVTKVNTTKNTLTLTANSNTYEVTLGKKIKETLEKFKINQKIIAIIYVEGSSSPILTLYKNL